MWDAAYALGSLSAADRREFEVHMANCPACRDAVADLSGVPALLSQLDREEVAAIDHMSVTCHPRTGSTGGRLSGRRRGVPRYAVDRALDLGSLLQFPNSSLVQR